MSVASPPDDKSSARYAGWRVVLACYLAALFCWGFGLYGHGVYLTELHRLHGWPTALISAAITVFYLFTAALVVFVGDAIARLGPTRVMATGACCFTIAVALLAVIDALWQLYAVYLLMAVGAATMHVGAISTVVGLWFDEKRPLAISLALNGASSGGVFITPPLVLAISAYGFSRTMLGARCVDGRGAAAGGRAVDRPPGGGRGTRRRARNGGLDAAERAAQHEVLERGGAVRARVDGTGRIPGSPDRDS